MPIKCRYDSAMPIPSSVSPVHSTLSCKAFPVRLFTFYEARLDLCDHHHLAPFVLYQCATDPLMAQPAQACVPTAFQTWTSLNTAWGTSNPSFLSHVTLCRPFPAADAPGSAAGMAARQERQPPRRPHRRRKAGPGGGGRRHARRGVGGVPHDALRAGPQVGALCTDAAIVPLHPGPVFSRSQPAKSVAVEGPTRVAPHQGEPS